MPFANLDLGLERSTKVKPCEAMGTPSKLNRKACTSPTRRSNATNVFKVEFEERATTVCAPDGLTHSNGN
jgi:hypothetical protein